MNYFVSFHVNGEVRIERIEKKKFKKQLRNQKILVEFLDRIFFRWSP